MKIQEINYRAKSNSINQISDGAAENQNQSINDKALEFAGLVKNRQNRHNRYERNCNEYQSLIFWSLTGEHAERNTRIANMRDAEKIINNPYRVMAGNMRDHKVLGKLVKNNQNIRAQQ